MENNDYRNITLSTKVCARQKAEYVKLANKNGISVSEWVACTIESNKNKYGKEGDPTKRELSLEKEIDTIEKQNVCDVSMPRYMGNVNKFENAN